MKYEVIVLATGKDAACVECGVCGMRYEMDSGRLAELADRDGHRCAICKETMVLYGTDKRRILS